MQYEIYLITIMGILLLLVLMFTSFAKKRLKFLEKELKSREEIIDKIVKLDSEMESYRKILLTKSLVELNEIYQELKGN
ncbi:MAG: hypothetical protein RR523_15895 [Cetobacterium sp.]|uniref:hypothetical protein n=1 Tax=Cetobacterium sp. TaxID=2071632 RepID=UPI002FC9F516